jgi:hypothetical protein
MIVYNVSERILFMIYIYIGNILFAIGFGIMAS